MGSRRGNLLHCLMKTLSVAGTAFILGLFCVGMMLESTEAAIACKQATVFVFGDSKSDTGNGVLSGNALLSRPSRPPYGITYPGSPFRRFCDGRLRLDYLTSYLNLPFLNPSLDTSANFASGVNYAVSGSTALSTMELSQFGIVPVTSFSLERQLGWHLDFKATAESSNSGNPPASAFGSGLYVIETGGNDYADAFQQYKPSSVISTIVPLVVQKMRSVTESLYSNGARNFVLIGVPAFGCTSFVLAAYGGTKDEDGCLQEYNLVASTHGARLLAEVESLRTAYPLATFTFVDFYSAYIYVLKNRASFGFENSFDACCGAGAAFPNNFNILLLCNERSRSLCSDPRRYINWDGIHYTDAFNSQIFRQTFITGSFLNPSNGLSTYCSSVAS